MTDYDIAKIAKSFCEATGMAPAVFHATVAGNIEQAYHEHTLAHPKALNFRDIWSWDSDLEKLVYHHEAEKVAASTW